jgi:hypothetical protein
LEKPLDWSYLAGWFDTSGSVYEKRKVRGRGLEARLRFSSYDREFLEQVRVLVGGGSITGEVHSKGPYYRLTVTGHYRVERVLRRMLPYLARKRETVKRWLVLHKAKVEIRQLKRRLRLKPGKLLRADARELKRAVQQLASPPPGDTN